jgi:endoglucanase
MITPALCVFIACVAVLAIPGVSSAAEKVCPKCHERDCEYMVGINWAGPEFAAQEVPGVEGRHFGWPTAESLDYWKRKGVRLIRLPFLWERLQPKLMNDFDPAYGRSLQRAVQMIGQREMVVILDVHNYAMYRKNPIGSPEVPREAFADLWRRLAAAYRDNKAVWGYGLMNEPNRKCVWLPAAQAAIDGIRTVDKQTRIFVADDYPGWATSGAAKREKDLAVWAEKQMPIPDPKALRDPSDRIRFELHAYFDHDASGTYRKTYAEEIARTDGPGVRVGPEIGITRIRPFVEWLKKHNVKGFIGEYSAPANPNCDERWLVALDKTLAYMEANCLPSAFWAGGTRWTPGNGSVIEPQGWSRSLSEQQRKQDRPQLKVLQKYMRQD